MRSTSAASSPTSRGPVAGTRRRPGRQVHAPARRPAAGPGPTSVWPPSTTGIGARRPRRVSARSHGSAIRSRSSRSEAKRSSAAGQRRSSAPSRWASRTRVSTMAASPSRARWSPNDSGPSRSSSAPRTDAAGRWSVGLARAQAALLDERPRPRGRCPLQPGQRRRGRPAGDSTSARGSRRPAGRPRVGSGARRPRSPRPRRPSAEQHQVERAVDVDAEAPAALAGPRPRSRRARPASAAARCRRAGRGWLGQPGRARRWRRCPPRSGCWRAPARLRWRPPRRRPADRRRRQRDRARAEDDQSADPAGSADRQQLPQARPERPPVGRPRDDRHVPGAGRLEASRCRSARRRPRFGDPPNERTGRRGPAAGGGSERRRGHRRESSRSACEARLSTPTERRASPRGRP